MLNELGGSKQINICRRVERVKHKIENRQSRNIRTNGFIIKPESLFAYFAQTDEKPVDTVEHIAAHGGVMLADKACTFLLDRIIYPVIQ